MGRFNDDYADLVYGRGSQFEAVTPSSTPVPNNVIEPTTPRSIGGIPVAAETGEFNGVGDLEIIDAMDEEPEYSGVGGMTPYPGNTGTGATDVYDPRPAALSIVPTSTTNPKRPRTVAAGYSRTRRVLTVIFRDGTWWNYYDVPASIWNGFKSAYSKGWYLRSSGLDTWQNMGPAMTSAILTKGEVQAMTMRANMLQQKRAVAGPRTTGTQIGKLRTPHMDRLNRLDATIKSKGIKAPDGKISNPYIERQRKRKP